MEHLTAPYAATSTAVDPGSAARPSGKRAGPRPGGRAWIFGIIGLIVGLSVGAIAGQLAGTGTEAAADTAAADSNVSTPAQPIKEAVASCGMESATGVTIMDDGASPPLPLLAPPAGPASSG